jgi:hexosaminidase
MSVARRENDIACSLAPCGSWLKPGRLGAALLTLAAAACAGRPGNARVNPAPERYPVVPSPLSIEARPGEFRLDSATRIVLSDPASAELRVLAEMLAAPLRAASGGGLPLPVSHDRAHEGGAITIELISGAASVDSESYHLAVTPAGVTLSALRPVGLFHGLETIRQLLPPEVERAAPARWTIPAVVIDDTPRFPYRGVLLDVARWYYPAEFLEKVIDLLALYKLNTLHLHLTDDQGWRLEHIGRHRGGATRP